MSEKLVILKKFEVKSPTETTTSFAKSVGLSESSVRKIVSDRQKLYDAVTNGDCKRRKLTGSRYEDLEEILLEWLQECR